MEGTSGINTCLQAARVLNVAKYVVVLMKRRAWILKKISMPSMCWCSWNVGPEYWKNIYAKYVLVFMKRRTWILKNIYAKYVLVFMKRRTWILKKISMPSMCWCSWNVGPEHWKKYLCQVCAGVHETSDLNTEKKISNSKRKERISSKGRTRRSTEDITTKQDGLHNTQKSKTKGFVTSRISSGFPTAGIFDKCDTSCALDKMPSE